MPTRYKRSDQQIVNGLTAYILGTSESSSSLSIDITDYYPGSLGIRVFKRHSDGSEDEITAGAPVALVAIVPQVGIELHNTWSCPQTSLATTDAIVVRLYAGLNDQNYQLLREWITEQIGQTQLDATTWTVYYHETYSERVQKFYYQHGSPTVDSRIEGESFSTPAAAARLGMMDGFIYVG